ncbi:competence/damage-inducible protein A [Eikenella sp. S3360]|uniref:Competence/damage-inducible protein A n=1 Tax=Eikenella glucosivorans TaxID=2766967 RepID=A0ABS0ND30_9NEIS|nr:molybdopterin-binding protein [Eikenella glucosivorans]MBH5330225.1 competence/damage-inducible protein A [Eikenella glucosivorans]
MTFSLIVVGDEILHGSRQDKHFAFFKQLLKERGLLLDSVQYLPDSRPILASRLRQSFAEGRPTFITGGIGSTPDDHTRQAAAEALGLSLELHPQAAANIEAVSRKHGDSPDSPGHHIRLRMAEFPQGSSLIPNPYNNIAGFSIREHYFLPGFPVMAQPMAAWVLDHYYAHLQHQTERRSISAWVDLPESRVSALMADIEQRYPGIRSFSLPATPGTERRYRLLFGLKAEGKACAQLDQAWREAEAQLKEQGATQIEWAAEDEA